MSEHSNTDELIVIGGGLAGCEAAWQAAESGVKVRLFEMRPGVMTGAHTSPHLAELVCSNSLGSNIGDRASGLVKEELRMVKSLLIKCADETALPAGGALAVDREVFATRITQLIEEHKNIEVVREEATEIPNGPAIIASGPLTSKKMSDAIVKLTGEDSLYFYDALAPIVTMESINMETAFRASRYGRGEQSEGDYINCAMGRDEYEAFVEELIAAKRIELKEYEKEIEQGVKAGAAGYFEGCLPVEIIAGRGRDSLAFGPMRPVGLSDPRTGKRPHAVLQLRQDNLTGTMYNLVGFQTNLKYSEQERVFRMIPGLENAEFVRHGQMHRNTFIASPRLLRETLQYNDREDLFFAGQLTGVEGYVGNIATGLLAGLNMARLLTGKEPVTLPRTTMTGALCYYVTHEELKDFQPMKANFGILPALETSKRMGKRERASAYAERSLHDLREFLTALEDE